MILLLTGTPGTGKTSVAAELEGFETVDLKQYARENGLGTMEDEFVVSVSSVNELLQEKLEERNYVLEGHFAHRLEGDVCVVLRCHPDELQKRLDPREYPDEKVRENLEAEATDIILQEAVEMHKKVIEIDTTGRDSQDVANELRDRVEEGEFGYGGLDFSGWL